MSHLVPLLKPTFKTKLRVVLTFFFLITVVIACEEDDEVIAPVTEEVPVVDWKFSSEASASIDRIKGWYDEKMSSEGSTHLRSSEQELAWFMAEHSSFGKDKSATAVPVMEPGNDRSLKTLYLFENEEGIKGFILEQKPDKRDDILLTDDFSGEISLYSLDGTLRSSSEMKHGQATKIRRTSIAS